MNEPTEATPIARIGLVRETQEPVVVPAASIWPMLISVALVLAAITMGWVWIHRWRRATMELYQNPRAFASRALAAAQRRAKPARA